MDTYLSKLGMPIFMGKEFVALSDESAFLTKTPYVKKAF